MNEEILDNQELPEQIIVLYLNQDAYNGSYNHNPLYFEDLLTREVKLRKDEILDIPPKPYEFELCEKLGGKVVSTSAEGIVTGTTARKKRQTTPSDTEPTDLLAMIEAEPADPAVLCNYSRAFLEFVQALGHHKKTQLIYDDFIR